jgi:hypothetical protein
MSFPSVVKRKYRNVPTEYGGRKYASKAEAARAAELDLLLRAGQIRAWQPQVLFRLGSDENCYRPDFLVWHLDGSTHAEDVKGKSTPKFEADKRRWLAHGPCPLWVLRSSRGKSSVVEQVDPHDEIH